MAKKIKVPCFVKIDLNKSGRVFYMMFPNDQSADVFYNGLSPRQRRKLSECAHGFFAKKNHILSFEFDERMVLCEEAFFKTESEIEKSLAIKSWIKTDFMAFEQHTDGYKPFYLSFDEDRFEWRLTRWGMGPMAIASWPCLDEKGIESVFRLCSQYAERMPW